MDFQALVAEKLQVLGFQERWSNDLDIGCRRLLADAQLIRSAVAEVKKVELCRTQPALVLSLLTKTYMDAGKPSAK